MNGTPSSPDATLSPEQGTAALFDLLPLPGAVVDATGRVLKQNRRFHAWFGALADGGLHLRARFGRGDFARVLATLQAAQAQGHATLQGLRLLDDGDALHWVDLHVAAVGEGAVPEALPGMHFTVLFLDRTGDAERETERRVFKALLDSTSELIYATDLQGRFLMANRAYAANHGMVPADLVGRSRMAFMPLRDAVAQDGLDSEVAATRVPASHEEEGQGPQGERLWLSTHRFALSDVEGRVIGVGGIARDRTAEREARRKEMLSEAVFLNATEAIVITDEQTRILRVNPAFEKLTGFSAASVVGHRTRLLQSGRQDRGFYRRLWDTLHRDGRWQGEITNRRATGEYYTVWAHIVAMRDARQQITGYMAAEADVTQLKQTQNLLERLASFDSLTNLPNRTLLLDRLSRLIALSQRQQQAFSVLFCDLDHFKDVNDSLGHQVGDQLLRHVADRMQASIRAQDTVGRMGGDEFVFLLPGTDRADAVTMATKLQKRVAEPLELPGMPQYRAQTSFGVAVFPQDGSAADVLLRNADTAMYVGKTAGRGRVEVYDEAMGQATARSFDMANALKLALSDGRLELHYQPKFRLGDRTLCGAEALVRWRRPGVGLIGPTDFLPVAEKSGLMNRLDHWVLGESVRQLSDWWTRGLWDAGWRLAVNQTYHDLQQPGFSEQLQHLLAAAAVPGASFEIEINEGVLVKPSEQLIETLTALRSAGIALSIDDFGTGYSSLSYLKQLPISAIKIDRTFVRDMLVDGNDRSLIEAITSLGMRMGRQVIAEGIETEDQCAALAALGCQVGQGYLVGAAMPAQEFEQWLGQGRPPQ